MIAVGLKNVSAVKGEVGSVRVSHEQVFAYRLIEIEIFDAGVQNPSHKLSFSVQPIGLDDHGAHIEIDSSLLSLGIFEVRRIRLLEPLST